MSISWFTDKEKGVEDLADGLADSLQNQNTLWLIPGGSNIPLSVRALQLLREKVSEEILARLTVTLTDERYGAVGHADSNWEQLRVAGFDTKGFTAFPVLTGASLKETVTEWGGKVQRAFTENGTIIGQFGIGADGHIAGILPHSGGVTDAAPVFGYEAGAFTRITLTTGMIAHIAGAYVFAFGESKLLPLQNLAKDISLEEQPSQILKRIPHVHVYSDVSA